MWQYTKDILPWWVLYNTNVLFNVSVGMINKKKVKTKKSYFVKYLIAIIMITSFDLMQ